MNKVAVCFLVLLCAAPMPAGATVVQLNFNCWVPGAGGPVDHIQVQLFDAEAPVTVASFLQYVGNREYDGSFIHRSVQGFVIQGGGYRFDANDQLEAVPSYGPIINEFDPSRSNVRGTIAMAKVEGDPNSATNQWFFNLADNSANLDYQNGGFTVFGQVLGEGMLLADGIGNLPTYNFGGPFSSVPLIGGSNLVMITDVVIVPEPSAVGLALLGGTILLTRVIFFGWNGYKTLDSSCRPSKIGR